MGRNPYEHETKMIEEILDNFDFHKCWNVMMSLQWGWGFQNEIPDVDRLKKSAIERLRGVIDYAKKGESSKLTYYSSSGGLKATAWINRYRQIEGLQLEFVLTDWTSEGDY